MAEVGPCGSGDQGVLALRINHQHGAFIGEEVRDDGADAFARARGRNCEKVTIPGVAQLEPGFGVGLKGSERETVAPRQTGALHVVGRRPLGRSEGGGFAALGRLEQDPGNIEPAEYQAERARGDEEACTEPRDQDCCEQRQGDQGDSNVAIAAHKDQGDEADGDPHDEGQEIAADLCPHDAVRAAEARVEQAADDQVGDDGADREERHRALRWRDRLDNAVAQCILEAGVGLLARDE